MLHTALLKVLLYFCAVVVSATDDIIGKLLQCKFIVYFYLQLVAKEHSFVMWADASIRFGNEKNVTKIVNMGIKEDLVLLRGDGTIAGRTLPRTFTFFDAEPCHFRSKPEIQAGFSIMKVTKFFTENILKPWVACALTTNCMIPSEGYIQYYVCPQPTKYGGCHRFDQSAWGIILSRLYGDALDRYKIADGTLVSVRGGDIVRNLQDLDKI